MIDYMYKKSYGFFDLVDIMRILRSEEGCPWDREQDHHTIRKNFIEEVYEAAEAIDQNDSEHLCEELGDVLLQVVFHAQMEDEAGRFNIDNVTDGVCKKLILRHPHIFGNCVADTSEQVLENWDNIKKKEKGFDTPSESITSVAKSLPSLMRAEKLLSRTLKEGLEQDDFSKAVQRLSDSASKLKDIVSDNSVEDNAYAVKAFEKLLFCCVNLGKILKIDCENAMELFCDDFCEKVREIERSAAADGLEFNNALNNCSDELFG